MIQDAESDSDVILSEEEDLVPDTKRHDVHANLLTPVESDDSVFCSGGTPLTAQLIAEKLLAWKEGKDRDGIPFVEVFVKWRVI